MDCMAFNNDFFLYWRWEKNQGEVYGRSRYDDYIEAQLKEAKKLLTLLQ